MPGDRTATEFEPLDVALPPADERMGGTPLLPAREAFVPDSGGRRHESSPPMRAEPRGPRPAAPGPPDIAGVRPPEARRRLGGEPARAVGPVTAPRADGEESPGDRIACTAPQLRRFIKSRVYVPMHELRRRFSIVDDDDEVTGVEVDATRIYVGLPVAEGRLLGDLMRNGEVGYELSKDPATPVVIGVYSMRPVSRS